MYLPATYPLISTGCIFIPIIFIRLNGSHDQIKGAPSIFRPFPVPSSCSQAAPMLASLSSSSSLGLQIQPALDHLSSALHFVCLASSRALNSSGPKLNVVFLCSWHLCRCGASMNGYTIMMVSPRFLKDWDCCNL